MIIVHNSITSEEKLKRGKLSNNKEAIKAGVILWKIKNNARLDKLNQKTKQA